MRDHRDRYERGVAQQNLKLPSGLHSQKIYKPILKVQQSQVQPTAAKMKFTITLVAIAAQLAGFAAAVPADTQPTDCGELGVLEWKPEDFKDKPEVDLSAIRKCKEPFAPGESPEVHGTSSVKRDDDLLANPLHKRACWYGAPSGCSKEKGRCWKKCGDGPWCWTARNGGFGSWYTCSNDSDCGTGMDCGQSTGNCKECGCSC
ncbi:hypothetical protein RB595_007897 [Gaeumannomyces hyphopodioides]